ncbi:acyl-CoA thioesterase [Parahaliea sp. F7430]|uniref:Acyl-CoA thioesterase n=1 Tax=Sediminihaliea albiluteola TaxID=2758564 RepID=A0A7W2YJ30_9GAMM|nr:thioesterase family protein [Sediminihaliea albiluteola]MBA6413121.1 acyl-CoA thioesterase [Sediminihaliea albiluteola]
MNKSKPLARADYRCFCPLTTRWSDNDIYGHVNNVVYYSYFDSAVNRYLIERGGLDIHRGEVVGFVVSSDCEYFAPISYPETIEAGLRVEKLGHSSVRYGVGIFREGRDEAVAQGHFVHVFVERSTNKAVTMPEQLRAALEAIHLG